MKRTLAPLALFTIFLASGCAAFYPTESRVVTSNWVSSPFEAQFQGNLPPDNTPVPYCYNTIGVVECHYAPLPGREASRIVNGYTGATPRVEEKPPEDDTMAKESNSFDLATDADGSSVVPPAVPVRVVPTSEPPAGPQPKQ